MKGAKSSRTQNDRNRKGNKRSEKSAKLDRKSSRGMIYENEELRLRTININAEVERGQSDIKRLRRENEHLRREIWTLRDECDRLNKRFKAKLSEHEYGGCRGSGSSGRRCSGGGRASAGCDGNSDDSDSCDTCRCEDDGHCSDECCQEGGSCASVKPPLPAAESRANSLECNAPAKSQDSQPMQFDHLSVVSEETFSNPEMMLSQQPEHHLMICNRDLNGSQSTLRSLVAPLTPLTPVELVANQLNDLQATVPPLSYFENILSQHMGHNQILTPTPELGTSSSTTTGMTMKHTNGWDYNLQSPFSQRKYSNPSSPSRSPPPQPLTTFVPPATTLQAMPRIALNVPTSTAVGGGGNIETVAITTNATHQALNSPKHFFAPMKSRLRIDTELANRGQDSLPPGSPPPALETAAPMREPPDIFVNNALATPYQRPCPRISPHTDSVNLESILNDIETISEDILAIQLEKSKSRDNIVSSNDQTNNKDDTKKPYRSEMNLYLQYEGSNPEISNGTATTGIATAANYAHDANSMHKLSSRTRSLEREHTDSPAPHMPDPMAPFPEKCSYLGFEQLNQAAVVQQQSALSQKPPISVKPNLPAKPPPPLPPARRPAQPTEPPPAPPVGIAPNKSHLYKSIASAAASKRAIFSSTPSQLTRSLDVEVAAGNEAAVEGSDPLDDEAAKRKARRVSIVCGEEQQAVVNGTVVTSAPSSLPTATASCIDLTSAAAMVLQHPSVKAFRQISHSTPSSPHSSRRRTNSNTMTAGHAEVAATSSAPPSTTHHHHHRKESSDPAPMAATATATVSRTKCSRRHSEGTVHNAHRISNSSGGHHHHHTHHHQHSSLISSNPHHSHHSHQDSNHETVTSLSDRNSNSFGSSRESSTSFSMRSNRRKISISSNTGGKIPWCGCWGNGCL